MTILEEFINSDMYKKLDQRAKTMALMVEHVEKKGSGLIVETGTARTEGNWGGDGQSTLIWDWLADKLPIKVKSVDLSQESVDVAKKQVRHTEVICSDSVKYLSSLKDDEISQICLLYLDSFDWHTSWALDCQFHHMAELATVWAKLPSGCMIVVDDRHSAYEGKHLMVHMFMEKLQIWPSFVDYQIGWIKP